MALSAEKEELAREEKPPIGERLAGSVGFLSDGSLSPARIGDFFRKSLRYFQEVWIELKNVTWPGRKEVTLSTTVVVATCLIIMVILWVLDVLFSWLMGLLLG